MALSFRNKLLLATPVPATWMSNVIIHNVYIKFYTDVIGLPPAYVGWVYLIFNLWNILNDPIIGYLLDKMKYRPRRGKYILVMRRTIPFMLVGLAAMAWSSPSWSEGMIFTVFLLQLFLFDVASTFYLISAISYGYLAAPTREDRIDVEVVKSWVGNITSAFATILATQLLVGDAITEHTTMATILMGVVPVNAALYLVPAIKLKDPPELYENGDAGAESVSWVQLKKDAKSIMSMRAFWAWFAFGTTALAPMGMYFTAFLYLMDHVIRSSGTEATITDTGSMVVVLVLLPLLARAIKRLGSRTAIYCAFVPYLGGLSALFFVTTWWQVLIAYIFIMTGRYMMTTAGVALEGALIDDNERLTGTRKTGSFASLRALMSAPLTGTQTTIFMWIIAAYGYDQSAEIQSAAAQWGIRFATAGVPIIFGVLGLVALLFLPYSKLIEAEISEFSRSSRGEGTAFKPTSGVPAPADGAVEGERAVE